MRVRRRGARSFGATRLRARRGRSRPHVWLWLAGLCLALFAASGLGRSLHFALVEHERCEHGHFVHPHHAEPVGGHGHAATAHEGRGLLPAVAQGQGDGDGHEHCDAVAVPPADVPSMGAAVSAQCLDWQLVDDPMAHALERQPIALLARAPKSSPPRG